MREIGINENRRVQGLGTRQREQLLQETGISGKELEHGHTLDQHWVWQHCSG